MGCPLPPSLQNLLVTQDSEREAAARRAQESATGPAIVGRVPPGVGLGGSGVVSGAPPGKRRGGADGDPFSNPRPI